MDALYQLAWSAAEVVIPESMKRYLEGRKKRSFDILVEELRIGNVDPEEAAARDEVAAMFVKFYQAMAQGAAFRNLRIIAKILAHKAADPKERTDDFIMWADAIGGMTRDECIVLATLLRIGKIQSRDTGLPPTLNTHDVFKVARIELCGAGKRFSDTQSYYATCSAMVRTGLVIPASGYGSIEYVLSIRAVDLANMVLLDEWADEILSNSS